MRAILVTQCVQNDFVRPLADDEPLPNLVHVGRLEAARLAGALPTFLSAAHALSPDELAIVHVVDRHDPERHAAHLEHFRPHCLAGTPGAELVAPVERLAAGRPATWIVPAGDLNDFEDSPLAATIEEAMAGADAGEVKIGVVGVWTDAKVAFLLYDLRTRLRARQLATCSALTASRSLEAHFRALEGLTATLGVPVLHSPGSFLDWLVPGAVERTSSLRDDTEERSALLDTAAGGAELVPLAGGFSGAQVFVARRPDRPARVVKIGAREEIARERFGNERVGRVLGDVVPRVHDWREGARLGLLQVELAQSASGPSPTTFKRLYESEDGDDVTALLGSALDEVLLRMLGRFYRTAEKDNADLLETWGFTDSRGRCPFGASVVERARAAAHPPGDATSAAAVAAIEELYLRVLPGRSVVREVFPSIVHGDLNLANILLARRPGEPTPDRVWIIDFARLLRLPPLTDFAKLENDLAYVLHPIGDEAGAARAERLQALRLGTPTLEATGLADVARSPAERRHAHLVERLRAAAAQVDGRGAAAMEEYRFALLRYAAHTLGFEECDPWQRRLALLGCGRLATDIMRSTPPRDPDPRPSA